MGYLSDTIIAMPNEEYMKLFLSETIPEFFKEVEREVREENSYWFFEGYKWYDSYPHIIEIEKLLSQMDIDETPYGFLRLGEEHEDIETRGNPEDYDIYVQHRISSPILD